MMDSDIEARLTALEMKLAHLDDFVGRLQGVVVDEGRQTELHGRELAALKGKIQEIAAAIEEIPDSRPPHY